MLIGFATSDVILPYVQSDESPLLTRDDAWLAAALRRRGHELVLLPWRSSSPPETAPDVVLIRSTWDYSEYQEAFLSWLRRLEQQGIPVFHSHELCRWNSDKRYLGALEFAGVPIVPTRYIGADEPIILGDVMAEEGWPELVVKPVIGAAGRETFRLNESEARAFQPQFRALQPKQDWMLQPFVSEVLDEGEWSLIYWRGEYSHAVRKFAREGEFRVQDDHGGRAVPTPAPTWLQQQAAVACSAIPFPWLYARVDGIVVQGQFRLMELELIEPELFFRADPTAADRFLDVLEGVVSF